MEKPGYRRSILTRRIPAVLVPYVLLTLLYWGFHCLAGETMTFLDVLKAHLVGVPVVDYSWYIVVILLIYSNFYVSTFLFRPGTWAMVAYHAASIAAWAGLCRSVGWPFHWYHTVMTFAVGLAWAMAGETLTEKMQKHYVPALILSLLVFLVCYGAALKTAEITRIVLPLFWAACCAFIPLLLLVLMKFSLGNPILRFLGKISFELYGLQGLFIRLFRSELCYIENDTLWCAAVIAASTAGGWLLHVCLQRMMAGGKKIRV